MGILVSMFCACLYCFERSVTWVVCSALIISLMFLAFMMAMYGITIGYHMAQKKMNVIMERKIAKGDVDHDPKNYTGTYHRMKRSKTELDAPWIMTEPIPPAQATTDSSQTLHGSLRISGEDMIKEYIRKMYRTTPIFKIEQGTQSALEMEWNAKPKIKQIKLAASNEKSKLSKTILRRFYDIADSKYTQPEKQSALNKLQEKLRGRT